MTGDSFAKLDGIWIAPEHTGAGTVTLDVALIDRAAGIWIPVATFAGVATGVENHIFNHSLEAYVRLSAVVAPVTDLTIRMRAGASRF